MNSSRFLRRLLTVLIVLLFFAPLSTLLAQLDITYVGKMLGTGHLLPHVAIKGDIGYTSTTRGVGLYHISTDSITFLGTIDLPLKGSPRLRIVDTFLLAFDSKFIEPTERRLAILSVADPSRPHLLYDGPEIGITDATIQWPYLFDSRHLPGDPNIAGSVGVFSIADPDTLLPIDGWPSYDNGFHSISVVGNSVYAREHGFDNAVITVFTFNKSGRLSYEGFVEPEVMMPEDIIVADSFLIVSDYHLTVYRVKAPGEFEVTATYEGLPGGYFPEQALIRDSLVVFRASKNPTSPTGEIVILTAVLTDSGTLDFRGRSETGLMRGRVWDVSIDDDRLFWSSWDGVHSGSVAVDGTVTTESYRSTGTIGYDVDGVGRTAYVVATDSLLVLDFTDPSAPQRMASYSWRGEGVKVLSETRILVFDSTLALFDVSNPRFPVLLDTLHLGHGKIGRRAVNRDDGVVAVAAMHGGAHLVSTSGDSLHLLASLPERDVTDVYWHGPALYVTGYDSLGAIWDVTNVAEPGLISRFFGTRGVSIAGFGDTISAIVGGRTIFYDVSDALFPQFLRSDGLDSDITGHQYHDNFLFVSEGLGGLSIRPLDPINIIGGVIAVISGGGSDGRFYVTDSLILGTEFYSGLTIYAIHTKVTDAADPKGGDSRTVPSLTVRPNVTAGRAVAGFALRHEADVDLSVVDVQGRIVYRRDLGRCVSGDHTIPLDLSLPPGYYICRISADNNTVATPLIMR